MLLPGLLAQSAVVTATAPPKVLLHSSEITETIFPLNMLLTSRCLTDLCTIRFKCQHNINL